MIGTKSCLLIFDNGKREGEQDDKEGSSKIVRIIKSIAHIYYELEDNGITVNFASSSTINSDIDVQALLEGEGSCDTLALKRFAQDERACSKLIQAIALDRAALFRGVSFDGICFVGRDYMHLDKSPRARKMLQLMYELGRVVGAFEECNVILHHHLSAFAIHDYHKNGIQVCDTSQLLEAEFNEQDSCSKHLRRSTAQSYRDSNVVTASAKQASSLEKGASLLKSAILNEREDEQERKGRRRPWWLPLPLPFGAR